MSEWVLVPVKPTEEMLAKSSRPYYDDIEDWDDMVAARPPIPLDVWDAMVERGARVLLDRNGEWLNNMLGARLDADAALRAALGNPVVEGDPL